MENAEGLVEKLKDSGVIKISDTPNIGVTVSTPKSGYTLSEPGRPLSPVNAERGRVNGCILPISHR